MTHFRPFNLDDAIPRKIREHCRALEEAGINVTFQADSVQAARLSKDALASIAKSLPTPPSTAFLPRPLAAKFDALNVAMRDSQVMQTALCYGFCAEIRKTGVKVFRPSMAQCVAMEHVAIEIPLADYRQPYPTIIIEYPSEYAGLRQLKHRFAICHHDDNYLAVWRRHDDVFDDTFISSIPQATLEEALRVRREGAVADSPCKEAVRVAVNCCMMLANYPIELRNIGSAHIVRANRQRARRQGRRYLPPREITFVQNIEFHEERTATHSESRREAGDVRHRPTPHWRKGHWRRQRFGNGHEQIRTIFIKPVLVNARFDTGDPSMRQAIYEG